ncbi:unnamed protein product [Rangifer tarandus platyrhynchus]|uniref:Uncharacterized protein n=1 Tax=Rangifer tarandus platyrhynchus TaxID=3082113 RepID=A0AC59YQP3_RANTA
MQSGRLQARLCPVHSPSPPPPAPSPEPAPAARPRTIHPGERRGLREGIRAPFCSETSTPTLALSAVGFDSVAIWLSFRGIRGGAFADAPGS